MLAQKRILVIRQRVKLITPHRQQLRYQLCWTCFLPRKAYTEVRSIRALSFTWTRSNSGRRVRSRCVRWLPHVAPEYLALVFILANYPQFSPSQPTLVRPPSVITSKQICSISRTLVQARRLALFQQFRCSLYSSLYRFGLANLCRLGNTISGLPPPPFPQNNSRCRSASEDLSPFRIVDHLPVPPTPFLLPLNCPRLRLAPFLIPIGVLVNAERPLANNYGPGTTDLIATRPRQVSLVSCCDRAAVSRVAVVAIGCPLHSLQGAASGFLSRPVLPNTFMAVSVNMMQDIRLAVTPLSSYTWRFGYSRHYSDLSLA